MATQYTDSLGNPVWYACSVCDYEALPCPDPRRFYCPEHPGALVEGLRSKEPPSRPAPAPDPERAAPRG